MYNSADQPAGRAFMAYKSIASSAAKAPVPGTGRVWEDVRKEARKLEGEMEVKLAAYAKLCSGFDTSYRHRSADTLSIGADQLAQSKAAELEDLLQRLSDLNDEMGGLTGGINDSRSHHMTRHREILADYTQEFRRLNSTLGATRDRVQLLAGSSDSPHIGLTMASSGTGALLRERGTIQNSTSAIDSVIQQAEATYGSLKEQRGIFDSTLGKLDQVASRFPVVNSLLNAIRRKKSKDTLILGGVIAACVLFTILYIWWK